MLPAESAAGPAPAIHRPPLDPLGVTFSTLDGASVAASKAMIHPVYGSMSQCEVHAVMIWPFSSNRAARSSYCFGSNATAPPELPAPVPGNDAATAFGPP